MRKATITRVWLGGLIGIVAGLLGAIVGTILLLAYGGTWGGWNGGDFVPTMDAFFWWMVGLITTGALVAVAGAIVQVVAWIGALINTYAAPDKAWFVVLLIGGLLGIAIAIAPFVVMVVYLLSGPDGDRAVAVPPAPATFAPAS
ncbi:MAG TPA: hypothetical protein VIC57_15135 [Candidatus Dormibacteraeota bacterium]|jgi:hypothetical protein